jgi:LytR_cpsA_psr family/LytR cell envelope-related transcriptional attenuator
MAGKHRRGAEPTLEADQDGLSEDALAEDGLAEDAAPAQLEPDVAAPGVPVGQPVVSLVPGHASARRAVREERRQHTRRLQVVAGVVVLALVAGLVWYLTSGRTGTPDKAAPVVAGRTQHTLLLQVVDAQQSTLATVLLGHDSTGQGAGFGALIPSTLLVNAPGVGSVPMAQTSTNGGPSVGPGAVADAMGVTVDGGWELSTAGLAALVDAVGGVDVTVDEDIQQTAPSGSTVVLIPAGAHHLGGQQAAMYATFLDPGAPEQERLARLSTVLQALLAKLPTGAAALTALIAPHVTAADATVPPSRVVAFLAQLQGDAAGARLTFDNLPTHPLDSGTATPTLVVDNNALPAFIKADFAGSIPKNSAGAPFSALIQNGVGTPGLDEKARQKLAAAGIQYIDGANASSFGNATSTVLIADGSDLSQRQGAAVARALKLPSSDIKITDQGQSIAAVVVILGADFKP